MGFCPSTKHQGSATGRRDVAKLRQVEVLQSQGVSAADAIRQNGESEVMYFRWRKERGGRAAEHLKRLKEREREPAPCAMRKSVEHP